MEMGLSQQAKIERVGAAVAAADDTDDNSARLDMSGFEGVVLFGAITDCLDTGVAALTVEQNDADSDSGMAAISGAADSLTSAAGDDLNGQCLMVDVYRPQKRYVQGVRTSTVANIAFGELYAVRYGARKKPVTDGATVPGKTVVHPSA